MNDYDVRAIFEEMELELIASMRRNLSRHQNWESKEKMNWTMWQVEQLKTLEQFKKENEKIFSKKFTSVNNEIAKFLQENYQTAGIEQEKAILEHLAKGYTFNGISGKGLEGGFFTLNKDKMNALINAVTHDMEKAEHAMLRLANDQYRKTIFRAEVMANSGAFTLKQSIDKATEDFLKAGINCIEYKNGRRVNIATYAEMAIRTANKGAVLVSEGDVRKAYGIHTVRISKYGACSETCLPWQGRVYVDDVYSGGTKNEAVKQKLPLLSEAIDGGLFHPNCRHRATTYFPGVSKPPKNEGVEEIPMDEQIHRKNQLHIQQQTRLESGYLDKSNIETATRKKEMWEEKDKELLRSKDTNKDFDFMPDLFHFNDEKESNLIDVYIGIDKMFLDDGFEHMAIADGETGLLLKPIISNGSKKSVAPNDETLKFIIESEEKSLTLIHNHPKGTPFSITDIITTNEIKSIKESIVINSNGEVYFLSIPLGKEINLSSDKLIEKFKDDIIKQREECQKEYPNISNKDISHLAYLKFFERLGWNYGRKRF